MSVLLLSLLASVAFAQSAQSSLSLANVAIQPSPVVAGRNITVLFQLYNSYAGSLSDVNVQLTGSYPLLNFSPASSYLISTMGEGLYSGYFNYNIRVPSTVPSGVYTIDFFGTYHATTVAGPIVGTSTMPLSFYVNGIPNMTASISSVQVISGRQLSIGMQLANSGYTKASNITVRFLNTSALTVTGTSVLHITDLANRSSVSTNINYAAIGNVSSGTYSIPVQVSYSSNYNTTYTKQLNLTASVAVSAPDVVVMLSSPAAQPLYQGRNQTVTLQIQNIGTGSAKNVTVSLSAGRGITLLSSVRSFFIGDIEPGQLIVEPVLLSANGTSVANLTASIKYYPASYQNPISKAQVLNLSLTPAAQFTVVGESAALNPGATAVPITFVIRNTGTEEADQVQISLQTTYPITPVASTYYIQSVKPGATFNASFVVSADSQGVSGNYPITLFEQWKQANAGVNQQLSGSNNFFIEVSSAQVDYTLVIVAVVVVVIAAIVLRMRSSSKKKAKDSKK